MQIVHHGCIRNMCPLLTVPSHVDQECSYEVEGISDKSRSQANQAKCYNLIAVHKLLLGSQYECQTACADGGGSGASLCTRRLITLRKSPPPPPEGALGLRGSCPGG